MAIRKVGDCRILGELGKGGMATVYRGVHEALQREVAIKELPVESAKNKESMSRFVREALAMAGFHHQNIVTLYDFIEKNDAWYMIMELVDGPNLAQLMQGGPLPPEVSAVVAYQVAQALEHAHARRIVHRDLKPSNIMVATSGEVKLMDFGIALTEDLGRLTRTGLAIGTPTYMSPEQILGDAVDARSDLYSLGVVLYECLAGVKLYSGATPGEVFARITAGKHTSLHRVAPHVPRALRDIVKRCLKTKANARYADATQVRHALEAYLGTAVSASERAVLMSFLHSREKLSESVLLASLSQTQLTALKVKPKRRSLAALGAFLIALPVGFEASMRQEQWLIPLLRSLGISWTP